MPRPKRTKVAPSAPAPRVRTFGKPATTPRGNASLREGLNDLYDVSDPVEEVITSTRHVRRSNGKGKATALEMQSNAPKASSRNVASKDDLEGTDPMLGNPQRSPVIPSEKSLLEDLDLDSSGSDIEVGRKDTIVVDTTSISAGDLRRRPRQYSLLGKGKARDRSSSLDSNIADDTGLMSMGRKNTSILGKGKFKRRQREPSILGRAVARARSSSAGLEMDVGTPAVGSALRLGNFKRRAREPSILGTARKARPEAPPSDEDEEDEEDFNPEDESTPLNLSKTRTANTSSAGSSSNPRKRKLSARQVPLPSSPLPSANAVNDQVIVPATASVHDEAEQYSDAPASSEELPMPSIEARSMSPELLSETMAPPRSSSEEPGSPPLPRPTSRVLPQRAPSRGRRALRSRTPVALNNDSPPSSPPSLTHSPNGPPVQSAPKPRARRPVPPTTALSTAQLQALLPRRRRRGATRDPFDIVSSEDEVDVSGLASDDDELAHITVRAPPRRSLLDRLPAPLKKPSKSTAAAKAKSGGKATYSRVAAVSDKENEEHDPDDSLGPLPDNEEVDPEDSLQLEKRVGKKLKRVAKKFQEVDNWEMEFEDNTASSSSPTNAR